MGLKTNCLTHLLDLWLNGHRFVIYYNGDHCFAMNEKKVFDLNNTFKKDFLEGFGFMYIPLKESHNLETVIKIFNLDEKYSKILEEYYS